MKKKLIFLTITFLVLSTLFIPKTQAIECDGNPPVDIEPLKQYIEICRVKIDESQAQQTTLAETIEYFTTEIYLTQAEINKTQQDLNRLGVEIEELSGKIESIDYSLDDLTALFVNRVQQSYKQNTNDPFFALINSDGFSDFFRRMEYIKKVRDHDREVMVALEKSRLDYDNQKTAKEEKQSQVEALRSQLASQKNSLAQQKAAKDKLLSDTKNSEKEYQRLLSDAQAQLAAFSTFVSQQGIASILNGTTRNDPGWGTNGIYYNQREDDWASRLLPGSSYTMANSGCLVTSMAMVMSYYGKSAKPGDIASQPELFSFGDFRQGSLNIAGVNTTRTRIGYSRATLDNELASSPDKPVIVGIIQYGSSRPEHFFVIKSKDGDDYIIHDPFPDDGYDIKFSSRYPISSIAVVDKVTVN